MWVRAEVVTWVASLVLQRCLLVVPCLRLRLLPPPLPALVSRRVQRML
jgi:hypothetical protein